MKLLIKILLFPITLILNILLGLSKFLLVFSTGILGVLSFILFVIGIIGLIAGEVFTIGVPILILGYIISPWGLPKLGVWIINVVERFNNWLSSLA